MTWDGHFVCWRLGFILIEKEPVAGALMAPESMFRPGAASVVLLHLPSSSPELPVILLLLHDSRLSCASSVPSWGSLTHDTAAFAQAQLARGAGMDQTEPLSSRGSPSAEGWMPRVLA